MHAWQLFWEKATIQKEYTSYIVIQNLPIVQSSAAWQYGACNIKMFNHWRHLNKSGGPSLLYGLPWDLQSMVLCILCSFRSLVIIFHRFLHRQNLISVSHHQGWSIIGIICLPSSGLIHHWYYFINTTNRNTIWFQAIVRNTLPPITLMI